jgi:hypothetical protein
MILGKKSFGVALIAAFGTLLAWAQVSSATHVRPNSASPLYVPLVIAYKQCTAPNSTHGGGLSAPSCIGQPLGPRQESQFLQAGTPDANGAGANFNAFVKLVVKMTSPEDVLITLSATDIRCKPATSASVCSVPNLSDGPDYDGQVQASYQMRVTDHWNGVSGTDAGTMVDIPFPVNAICANSASTSVGSTCSANTTADAIVPGTFADDKRANVEVQTVQIYDGGASGVAGAPDETRFATEGIFIP